jgi:excisionase family DNA binding protein
MTKTEKSRSSVAAPERDGCTQNTAVPCEPGIYFSTFPAGLQGKLALKPKEAAPLLGVGVNKIYELCHRADFPAIRVGAGYIIPVDALQHWLCSQAGPTAETMN